MAYATVADVRQMAPQIAITVTTKPTEGDVSDWLTELEERLDGHLDTAGYVTPVVGKKSIKILREILVFWSIVRVLKARAFGVGGLSDTGIVEAQKCGDDILDQIMDGSLELTDAETTDSHAEKSGDGRFGFIGTDTDDPCEGGHRIGLCDAPRMAKRVTF